MLMALWILFWAEVESWRHMATQDCLKMLDEVDEVAYLHVKRIQREWYMSGNRKDKDNDLIEETKAY
jgi:hypothetical protein